MIHLPLAAAVLAYSYSRPFMQPLPFWNNDAWPWLLLPLCAGLAVVYKCIKCQDMKRVGREAATLFIWITGGMALAAGVLTLLVRILS